MTTYNTNFDCTKPFSDTCAQLNLSTGIQQTFIVPGHSSHIYRAKFEFNDTANIFVGLNTTATSPTAGTNTTTNNLEFRPSEPKFVKGGDIISAITPDSTGAYMGISLLTIPG